MNTATKYILRKHADDLAAQMEQHRRAAIETARETAITVATLLAVAYAASAYSPPDSVFLHIALSVCATSATILMGGFRVIEYHEKSRECERMLGQAVVEVRSDVA